MSELNPFRIAQQQLDAAAEKLGLDPATHELLRWPQRELTVTFPFRWTMGPSRSSMAIGFNTIPPGGLQRGVSDGTPMRILIRSVLCPPG